MLGKLKSQNSACHGTLEIRTIIFFDIIKLRFFDQAAKLHLFHVFTKLKMHHFIYFDQFCPVLRKMSSKIGRNYRVWLPRETCKRGPCMEVQTGFCQGGHKYSCLLESVCNEFLLDLSKRCKRKNT